MGCGGSTLTATDKKLDEALEVKATAEGTKDGLTTTPKQSAFVFVKPHANHDAVKKLVTETFAAKGICIVSEGEIDGPTIDNKKLIDQHYYAIASKATILPASELPVPAEKFQEKFGEEWATVLQEGRAFNALESCTHLGIDTAELDRIWKAATPADKVIKFGGGFYCALIEPEGKPPIYTFNAFFMNMRSKFTAPDAAIHYYVVEFDPATLPWATFRGEVLGPTDPAKAPASSLRGLLFAGWEGMGLKTVPNVTDNGVHASASPFEGLAERMNWLQRPLKEDALGKQLLELGIAESTLAAWTVDPRVPMPDGSTGSLFDALEDLDLTACCDKAVAISKCAT